MDQSLEIIIWDYNADRIAAIDHNLHSAMRKLNCQGRVKSMSEPPLLARTGVLPRVPVLEIDGMYWSLRPGEEIPETACEHLLARILSSPRHGPGEQWILQR
ncbi:hypothetical protein [Dethiosulfatarculus sandiegensis]|uniref:Uncharacterized protein n=1 Tax=Dethiosulfatarculus sandiegensis TaxID=1429043 RepID=A0A0D2J3V9_9BACT|nr:hypothetical protein [Dethiosulfatarculus sandiegensis]KIX12864.1 hypothetical protein X474_16845 [Dethiosulfatarculus sandiegensis]